MVTPLEFLIVFATAFGFNIIPFAGPSNFLIAITAAIGLGSLDTTAKVAVGVIIAFAAAFAKGIHYMVTFFVSGRLSQKRQARLQAGAHKIRRWAFPLLFLVAVTPLPDEPIVIPLGLMKYSPSKFFLSYFLGKLAIAVIGVFFGSFAGNLAEDWLGLSQTTIFILSIVTSIILTVVITVILLKVDVDKLLEKYKGKLAGSLKQTNISPAKNAIETKTNHAHPTPTPPKNQGSQTDNRPNQPNIQTQL